LTANLIKNHKRHFQ